MPSPLATRTAALALTLVAAAGALAGCGSSHAAATPSGSAAASGPATVQIKGFAFSPATLTVNAGTAVTFVQDDATVHTVTDQGVFDSGTLAQGRTWTHTFATPGTYQYICTIHPYMHGTVVVR